MKKLFVICILLLTSTGIARAQDNTKAKTILDNIVTLTKSYPSIEITFTYTLENKTKKIKETKTGKAFMKGEKYFLDFAGQHIISDGKTVWTFIKDNNEVQINTNDPNDDQSLNPAKLLTGYNKSFSPKFIKEETRGAVIFQIIDMTPIKPRSYIKIRLEIDKVKKQIINTIVYDKNGSTTYTYAVNTYITNKTIPDTKFTFKVADHPGVEVIDLR